MSLHKVPGRPGGSSNPSTDLVAYIKDIVREARLNPVLQPIIDLRLGTLLGYEGLIRGPVDGPLHAAVDLFRVAAECGLTIELEVLCCKVLFGRFAALGLPGRLFVNISPAALPHLAQDASALARDLNNQGLTPSQIVFELTEQPLTNAKGFHEWLAVYRAMGFQLALDDLGEGHSSLRRWSESRPDYVKVDMHFIQAIHFDPLKQQFVRSIRDIARESGALVIAEGIEQQEELEFLVSIDIRAGQGFYFAKPEPSPQIVLPGYQLAELLRYRDRPTQVWAPDSAMPTNAGSLLRQVPHASPGMSNDAVCDLFTANPEIQAIPVVDRGVPIGMIARSDLIGRFARPYQRELYGRRSCTLFMDGNPPIADQNTSLQQLGHILIEADRSRLISDFIITHEGRYRGIGTSYDLLRELTQAQIRAAKYSNPLTQLPGNVPLNLQIEHLLSKEISFCACYADLDNFKPFNDTFGYAKGDEIIQLTGQLLSNYARNEDFVGHIGGDDFLILWRSADWEARCHTLLKAFGSQVRAYLLDSGLIEDVTHDGYQAQNRAGEQQYFRWPSISLGAIKVKPQQYDSYQQIATAAAEAKAQAKNISGNSLYIEPYHRQLASPGASHAIH